MFAERVVKWKTTLEEDSSQHPYNRESQIENIPHAVSLSRFSLLAACYHDDYR